MIRLSLTVWTAGIGLASIALIGAAPPAWASGEVSSIQVAQVRTIEPVPVRPIQTAPVHETQAAPAKKSMPIAGVFGRVWQLNVPGAVWQTDNVYNNTTTLHVGAGSGNLPHLLQILNNGTYQWKAFDEVIRGRWVRGNSDYPIVLQKAYEGSNWHIRTEGNELRMWNGKSLAGQFHGREVKKP